MPTLDQIVFIGFNSRVAAIDRDTGQLVWQWRSPKGSGYTTVFLDGDRLIVSIMGYTYCLVPLTGAVLWFNALAGMGTGVASIASVRGCAQNTEAAARTDEEARRRLRQYDNYNRRRHLNAAANL